MFWKKKFRKIIKTKLVYTSKHKNNKGKFDIFSKPLNLTFEQAINNNKFVFQDPWWANDWKLKMPITVNSLETKTAATFEITLTSNDFDYSSSTGFDIRFTNENEDIELNYNRFVYGGFDEFSLTLNDFVATDIGLNNGVVELDVDGSTYNDLYNTNLVNLKITSNTPQLGDIYFEDTDRCDATSGCYITLYYSKQTYPLENKQQT